MARSQETFNKKQREKSRAKKKKDKLEKRLAKKDDDSKGIQIDWESAPVNNTLTEAEEEKRAYNKQRIRK